MDHCKKSPEFESLKQKNPLKMLQSLKILENGQMLPYNDPQLTHGTHQCGKMTTIPVFSD